MFWNLNEPHQKHYQRSWVSNIAEHEHIVAINVATGSCFFLYLLHEIYSQSMPAPKFATKLLAQLKSDFVRYVFETNWWLLALTWLSLHKRLYVIQQDVLNADTTDSRLHRKLFEEGTLALFIRIARYLKQILCNSESISQESWTKTTRWNKGTKKRFWYVFKAWN